MFLDGQQIGEGHYRRLSAAYCIRCFFGYGQQHTSKYFRGTFGVLYAYDRALSDLEIISNFNVLNKRYMAVADIEARMESSLIGYLGSTPPNQINDIPVSLANSFSSEGS